jgi:hypothetical protein
MYGPVVVYSGTVSRTEIQRHKIEGGEQWGFWTLDH